MKNDFCTYEQGMFATEPEGARDRLFFHQALAFHEAGHAVCGYVLGFGCSRIVMSETCDATGARAACAYFSARRAQARVYAARRKGQYGEVLSRHAIVCAAGPAAERRFYIEKALPLRTLSGAIDDHREIESTGARLAAADARNPLAFRRLIWRRAQKIIAEPEVWRAVSALAERLVGLLPPPTDGAAKVYAALDGPAARAIMRRAGLSGRPPGLEARCRWATRR